MNFRLRNLLLPALPATLVVLMAAGSAAASGAHVDRAFGTNGVSFLPSSLGSIRGLALLGDGRVLVGDDSGASALLASGQVDPSFGEGGHAALATPPSASSTGVSEVKVDPDGRPVLVGSAGFDMAEFEFGKFRQDPFIERLTPEGHPDPSFGQGTGYVVGGISVPPPKKGEPLDAYVGEVGFDSAGRILVTGSSTISTFPGSKGQTSKSRQFLARLQSSGEVDRSFADHGTFALPGSGFGPSRPPWAIGPQNQVTIATEGPHHPYQFSLLRLAEDGRPEPRFGKGGHAPLPPRVESSPLLVDSRGRTIVKHYLQGVEHRRPNGIAISRLRPDGSLDRSFGDDGVERLRLRRFYAADLALDDRDRILMAISLKERGQIGEPNDLAIMRLRRDGEPDKSFGHDGLLRIPFPIEPHRFIEMEGFDVRGAQAAIGATNCGANCEPIVALIDLGAG